MSQAYIDEYLKKYYKNGFCPTYDFSECGLILKFEQFNNNVLQDCEVIIKHVLANRIKKHLYDKTEYLLDLSVHDYKTYPNNWKFEKKNQIITKSCKLVCWKVL